LEKWLLPNLGDLSLADVDNATVKVVVEKMDAAGLSARTILNYVQIVKSVAASLCDPKNGKPIHQRKWNSEFMDLPEVKGQNQPSLTSQMVTQLIASIKGWERMFYILLTATGMRISEALALEASHFNTITIKQQVNRLAKSSRMPKQTQLSVRLICIRISRLYGWVFRRAKRLVVPK
jgi:integrase